MTDPLVPADVDLRDFGFMPLDVLRLRDSDLAALATGEEFKAAVLLWCVAWHQVPAASLPNDDRLLARFSGAGPAWRKVKTEALRGFVECSDGRLYHQTIAEKALESWQAKLKQRERTKAATAAREAKRRGAEIQRDEQRHDERNVERDEQRDVERDVVQGTVKGQGQGQGIEEAIASSAPAPAVAARVELVTRFKAMGIMPGSTPQLDAMVAAGITWDEIEPLLPQATGKRNAVAYIAAAVSDQRQRAAATLIAAKPVATVAANPDVAATQARLAAEASRAITRPPASVRALGSRTTAHAGDEP